MSFGYCHIVRHEKKKHYTPLSFTNLKCIDPLQFWQSQLLSLTTKNTMYNDLLIPFSFDWETFMLFHVLTKLVDTANDMGEIWIRKHCSIRLQIKF